MTPSVSCVSEVTIPVVSDRLGYEQTHAPVIDAHWAAARAANPQLFDGRVHFARHPEIKPDALTAQAIPARFATLHYWRHQGFPPIGVRHLFGFALLFSSDGAILLARMSGKTANAGRVYGPGGVVDQSDVKDERVDISGNVRRELAEETGLTPYMVALGRDYIVVRTETLLAVGHRVDLPWQAEDARDLVLTSASEKGDGEIDDILVFRCRADAQDHDVHPYAMHLLNWFLPDVYPQSTLIGGST